MPVRWPSLLKHAGAAAVAAVLLAACQESQVPKQFKPVPTELSDKMKKLNMSETGPVFIRIFKESSELEVWKQTRSGRYALLKTYDICKWSGKLGPKIAEGDRQAPEGFYTVTPAQMNPKSSYYLSFNMGFPNAFDRAYGRTGSNLMVHGACSSAGCYSMTDESAGELFALARDSFRGGQRAFQIQAFPFRMTPQNMAKHRDNPNYEFWQMLKVGNDHFELTRVPPKVDVCDKRYVFNADAGGRSFSATASCPPYQVPEQLKVAVAQKEAADEAQVAATVAQLAQEAERAAEEQRIAEEQRVAAEAEAAQKQAAKEARAEQRQEKLGIFGRMFGRDNKTAEPEAVAEEPTGSIETSAPPVTAFAPASTTPVPPAKPAASAASASPTPALPPSAPPPPAEKPVAQSETQTEPTIAPEMTPAIPEVGRFVKKQFLWIGDDGGAQTGG
jgi:murein L,D-transpeptidase YafK